MGLTGRCHCHVIVSPGMGTGRARYEAAPSRPRGSSPRASIGPGARAGVIASRARDSVAPMARGARTSR
jgi:hypothetical protein